MIRQVGLGICVLLVGRVWGNTPQTQWVRPESEVAPGATLVFERAWKLEAVPRAPVLRAAVDQGSARLYCNGTLVGKCDALSGVVECPLTRELRAGPNDLRIEVVARGGPCAIAAEVASADGPLLVTDDRWRVTVDDQREKILTQGTVAQEAWWRVPTLARTTAFDEYNQWYEARKHDSKRAAGFRVPPGFVLEEVFQAPVGEGASWISMTIDDRGRLLFGREKQGLLRLTLRPQQEPLVETMHHELRGNHGLLWTTSGLFVNASDSKALYRLRDTNGDDQFDEVRKLRDVPGGGGDHGRNDLLQTADGRIYMVHGDAVQLPSDFTSLVPSTAEFDGGVPRGGHVIRTDVEGSSWEVFCAGLRNPYGLALHRDGELFTYDADSERHVGLPWYRPTRMNHLVAGADYGWRAGGQRPWPIYHPDFLPPNVLIGRGSPTSCRFGYGTNFSPEYQNAFFAPDWAFGRLFCVHVVPRGATYSMHPEVMVQGRAFNVVDLEVVDGALMILTGGYRTQSVLYRLRYEGEVAGEGEPTPQQRNRRAFAAAKRAQRRQLETLQRNDENAVAQAWSQLGDADLWVRHAARVALERQPLALWEPQVWPEPRPEVQLEALLAYVRVAEAVDESRVWSVLDEHAFGRLDARSQQVAVRIAQWCRSRAEKAASGAARDAIPSSHRVLAAWSAAFPTGERTLDRELAALLLGGEVEGAVRSTLSLFQAPLAQEDALHYLMLLAGVESGWAPADRSVYFRLLQGAELFQGDEGLPAFVRSIRDEARANLTASEQQRLGEFMEPEDEAPRDVQATLRERPLVQAWAVADFEGALPPASDALRQRGAEVFREAQCARCHRLGDLGRAFGPDLTGLGLRYRKREILASILEPSASISSRYAQHVIVTDAGLTITGQVMWNGFRKSMLRIATDPWDVRKVTKMSKRDIVSHAPSAVSPMPQGLLNSFPREDVVALLWFLMGDAPGAADR